MHISATRAVFYIRVSTEKQVDHGVSLDAQRAKLTAYASLYNLDCVDSVVDAGISASSLHRPGLRQALTALESGRASALVVVKLDRLTRSVRDLGLLVERYFRDGKYALLSVSEQVDTRTAGGRLVLNVLASVAEWERDCVSERTSLAMRYKSAAGEFTGGRPPYGYCLAADGVHLMAVREEVAVIDRARSLRATGLSFRAISRALERDGMRNRHGRPFAHAQVARMVESVAIAAGR